MTSKLSHLHMKNLLHLGFAEARANEQLSDIDLVKIGAHNQLGQELVTGADSTSDVDKTLGDLARKHAAALAAAAQKHADTQAEQESRPSDSWIPFTSQEGLYGFAVSDKSGNQTTVIEPRFEEAFNFTDGRAAIKIGGKYGFIDEQGALVVPAEYDDAISFHEGVGVVSKEGAYSYIDASGHPLSENTYDYAWPLKDGLGMVKVDGKFGYVDSRGSYILPPIADTTFGFSEGLAVVSVGGRFGYIDHLGQFAVSTDYDYAWQFKNGEALVKSGDQYWIIDPAGRYVREYRPE